MSTTTDSAVLAPGQVHPDELAARHQQHLRDVRAAGAAQAAAHAAEVAAWQRNRGLHELERAAFGTPMPACPELTY